MFKKYSSTTILLVALLLSGCNTNDEEATKEKSVVETKEATDSSETTEKVTANEDHGAYPMPILDNWEEIEIVFKIMGDGKIELWTGEFSFEGDSSTHFESYQEALTEAGFKIDLTDDTNNLQSIAFTKTIDGKDYVGNTTFSQRWVKSGLQHFK